MATNEMLEQVLTFPSLLEQLYPELAAAAETFLPDDRLQQLDRIYLYGSGDSLNAAVCAAQAFARFARIPTMPLPALQASRYVAATLTPEQAARTLTVCISNSGEAARTAEAAMALRRCGCLTAILTARPDSRAGRATEHILQLNVPPMASSVPLPGTRSFVAPVLAMYLLAVAFGRRRGVLTDAEADGLRAELRALPALLDAALADGRETLEDFAALCGRTQRLEFLGAGPCRGAGDFGLSKVLEAIGTYVISQDMEEFAHQTFFSVEPEKLPTVLTIPSRGASVQRCREILRVVRFQGRPCLVLTDDRAALPELGDTPSVCLREPVREEWAPLVFAGVITCLTALMPLLPGDTYMHGHRGPYAEEGLPTVRESQLMIG